MIALKTLLYVFGVALCLAGYLPFVFNEKTVQEKPQSMGKNILDAILSNLGIPTAFQFSPIGAILIGSGVTFLIIAILLPDP